MTRTPITDWKGKRIKVKPDVTGVYKETKDKVGTVEDCVGDYLYVKLPVKNPFGKNQAFVFFWILHRNQVELVTE
jgi:hypothetical protein